jgi:rubredoxin
MLKIPKITGGYMHLFETEKGDRWICPICRKEQEAVIKEKEWEYIFDSDDPVLRCSICAKGEYDYDD